MMLHSEVLRFVWRGELTRVKDGSGIEGLRKVMLRFKPRKASTKRTHLKNILTCQSARGRPREGRRAHETV